MILALDIGGSAIKAAFARDTGSIVQMGRIETPRNDFAAFVETLRGILAAVPERPDAVSISICGVVDIETGKMICANVPCIDGRVLDADLSEALELPVSIAKQVGARSDHDQWRSPGLRLGLNQSTTPPL